MTPALAHRPDRQDLLGPFDRVFEELLGRAAGVGTAAIDVVQDDDALTIKADVPGIPPEEVVVEVAGDVLTISGSHEEHTESDTGHYLRRERRSRAFKRSIALPRGADSGAISASCRDGVLQVTVPLAADAASPRRIALDDER